MIRENLEELKFTEILESRVWIRRSGCEQGCVWAVRWRASGGQVVSVTLEEENEVEWGRSSDNLMGSWTERVVRLQRQMKTGEPGKPGKGVWFYLKSNEKLVKDLQQWVTKYILHFRNIIATVWRIHTRKIRMEGGKPVKEALH